MELEPQWKPTLQPPRFTSDLEQKGNVGDEVKNNNWKLII